MINIVSPGATPTVVSEGTALQGALVFQAEAQVFGHVEGEIVQQSLERLQIGRGGWVHGAIQSRGPVRIDGRVEGTIVSATKIELTSTAVVRGQLSAPAIEIRPGAVFDGELKMKAGKPKLQAAPAPSRKAKESA